MLCCSMFSIVQHIQMVGEPPLGQNEKPMQTLLESLRLKVTIIPPYVVLSFKYPGRRFQTV